MSTTTERMDLTRELLLRELEAARELLASLDQRPLPQGSHFLIRVRVRRIDRVLDMARGRA